MNFRRYLIEIEREDIIINLIIIINININKYVKLVQNEKLVKIVQINIKTIF